MRRSRLWLAGRVVGVVVGLFASGVGATGTNLLSYGPMNTTGEMTLAKSFMVPGVSSTALSGGAQSGADGYANLNIAANTATIGDGINDDTESVPVGDNLTVSVYLQAQSSGMSASLGFAGDASSMTACTLTVSTWVLCSVTATVPVVSVTGPEVTWTNNDYLGVSGFSMVYNSGPTTTTTTTTTTTVPTTTTTVATTTTSTSTTSTTTTTVPVTTTTVPNGMNESGFASVLTTVALFGGVGTVIGFGLSLAASLGRRG